MSHTCPDCGQECYCDGEDTHFRLQPADCNHQCEPDSHWDDRWLDDDCDEPEAPCD